MNKDESSVTGGRQPGFIRRILTGIPPQYRAQFEARRLETNVGRMHAFAIYVVVLQISLNIINMLKPSDTQSSDIIFYVALSLSTLVIGAIYWILLTLAKRGKLRHTGFKRFLVESLLYIYTAIQLTFCTLNIISTGGINSYIIAILIIGMVPIIRPLQSITSILLAFAYILAVIYLTRDLSGTWDSILLTDAWANLIIITVLVSCISVFMYCMYRSNVLQSLALEETVRSRTMELEEQTYAARAASVAKSQFLARMSHEIRTPLNAIMGMTQVARSSTDPAKTARSLNEIATASSHLMDILNDVLDMSKIESGKFVLANEPFLLRQAVREVIRLIALRSREKGLVFSDNSDEIPNIMVMGDKLRLKQVLINLLGNAVKFTPRQGKVDLKVETGEPDGIIPVKFCVSDSGIGMSVEQLVKLFDAFEQADSSIAVRYGGTGLGLAISQNLIIRMGGRIDVQSEPGRGSVFSFQILMQQAENQPERDSSAGQGHAVTPDLREKRILLVEDIDINRLIICELLEGTHVRIDEAADGAIALGMFADSPAGWYDLIFMDVQMPNMGGYEATRAIRGLDRPDALSVPIIAMTANAYREDIEEAMAAGMNAHLAKPIDLDAMLHLLAELV